MISLSCYPCAKYSKSNFNSLGNFIWLVKFEKTLEKIPSNSLSSSRYPARHPAPSLAFFAERPTLAIFLLPRARPIPRRAPWRPRGPTLSPSPAALAPSHRSCPLCCRRPLSPLLAPRAAPARSRQRSSRPLAPTPPPRGACRLARGPGGLLRALLRGVLGGSAGLRRDNGGGPRGNADIAIVRPGAGAVSGRER